MKSYHHGNLKQELIDCACKMCERDGYTKLSIRSLAKESNVSQTAPYRHFKTKEDLYAEIAKEGFNKYFPSLYPTLLAAIGPINGNPDIARAADEAIMDKMSG